MERQLFLVQPDRYLHPKSNCKAIVWGEGTDDARREDAKRKANQGWFGKMGRPDHFIVTPITNPGDQVNIEVPGPDADI